jgi:hypothetical protein
VRRLPAQLAVLVAVLATAPAHAATLDVTPSGTGTNCTQTSPCDTIREAYNVAQSGDTIQLAVGTYPSQGTFSNPATAIGGSKRVTVQGGRGVKVRQIFSRASNVTFDGLDLDAGRTKTSGAVFEAYGANTTFRNGRIGNVVDEKGALVGGATGVVFDNVDFHDVIVTSPAVHNECVFSQASGITIRNSRFTNCATMDVFFTRNSGQAAYGGFKLLNNFFGASKRPGGANHYYTVTWHAALGQIRDAEIRGNTLELPVNNNGMSAVNSVESCNRPQVNIPGIVHGTCSSPPTPDRDGDGVPDAVDACPGEAGSQPNGCNPPTPPPADRDGDGKADGSDLCPDVAGQAPDGCPLPDPVYDPACAPTCDEQIATLRADRDRTLAERDQARQQRDAAQALADQRKAKLDRILAILNE